MYIKDSLHYSKNTEVGLEQGVLGFKKKLRKGGTIKSQKQQMGK